MKRRLGPRGFLMLDALMAIFIASALIISFSIAVANLQRGERALAQQRAAVRRLEDNLLVMQGGGKVESGLVVERLPGDVPGNVWVRVSTPVGQGPKVSLVGLVPAGAVAGGVP